MISKASSRVAHNRNTCLSIHASLTGQKLNRTKSTVYFPSWLNGKITRRISRILNFTISTFPLTYLDVSISPRSLTPNHFQFMTSKVERLTRFWNHQHGTLTSKVILINGVLMSIPFYHLVV